MTEFQQSILKLLAKSTSTAPLGFDFLLQKTGHGTDYLKQQMDSLYEARLINQCQHTKFGITQMIYWPTAIVDKPVAFRISTKLSSDFKSPAPRRSEIAKLPPTPVKESIVIKNTEPTKEKPADNVLAMMQFIADNGKATGRELADLIGEKYASNIPARINYLAEGESPIISSNKDISDPKHPTYTWTVLPGKTMDDFHARRMQYASQRGGSKPKIKTETTNGAKPNDEIEIPSFLKISNQNSVDIPEIVNDQFVELPAETKATIGEFNTGTLASVNADFKLAITNQKTLILFGFGYSPIELSQQQTQEVADFLDKHHESAFV